MLKRFNIYDVVLLVLYVLLVFGMIGNGAQPVRLAMVALAPIMIVDVLRRPHESIAYYRHEVFFIVFWWIYSLGFMFKAVELVESVKHQVFFLIHLLGFFEVLWAANKARNPQRAICLGWIAMLILTLPVAVWEFTGGQHLWTTIMEDQSIVFGKVRIDRPYAAVTFGNLNSYNTVICWALPCLFTFALFPQKKFDTALALLTFVPLFLIVVLNSSRGAILCMGALIAIYVGCYLKVGKHRSMMLGLVVVAVFILAYYLYEMFYFIIGRFTDQGMSDDGRMENILKGIEAWWDSCMLGIGVGNYEPIMDKIYRVAIPAPHNLFLEIFVVWGIIIAVAFVWVLLRLYRRSRLGDLRNRYFVYFGFICLLFGGMVDSTYWMKAATWLYFSSLFIMADPRYNLKS